MFEEVLCQCSEASDNSTKLISHLSGDALDYYFDTFVEKSEFKEEAKSYVTVRRLLGDRFGKTDVRPERIRLAVNNTLDVIDLLSTPRQMDKAFRAAKFYKESKLVCSAKQKCALATTARLLCVQASRHMNIYYAHYFHLLKPDWFSTGGFSKINLRTKSSYGPNKALLRYPAAVRFDASSEREIF